MKRLFLAAASVVALGTHADMFRDGDRVVFMGDSITYMGYYVRTIADYYITRFPDRDIRFFQRGKGGSRLSHAIESYGRAVEPVKPTVVTTMFGMNDINRFLYNGQATTDEQIAQQRLELAEYGENLRKLDALIDAKSASPRRYYLTPTPYFDTADKRANVERHLGANAGLGACAAMVRAACTEHGGTLVDLNAAFDAFIRRWKGPDSRFVTGWDRVHPQEAGHLLMAYVFLKSQNADSIVSDVRFQDGRPICAINAEVSNVATLADGGVAFDLKERALPLPLRKNGSELMQAELPLGDELSQELVTFYVPDGNWMLSIDGAPVVTADANTWAKGVNLSFNENTPQYAQAQRVAAAVLEHMDFGRLVGCGKWEWAEASFKRELKDKADDPAARKAYVDSLPQSLRAQRPMLDVVSEYWGRKEDAHRRLEDGFAALRKLATPVSHHYELKKKD